MVVVNYVYDAWGNHKVLDEDGDIVGAGVPDRPNCDCATGECDCAVGAAFCRPHIGNLNPFRYRGYYWDNETGWHYLKTRYYDPQVRRFINGDNLSFLDPTSINGLNLCAYCLNNPINLVDPNGTTPKVAIIPILKAALKKAGIGIKTAAKWTAGKISAGFKKIGLQFQKIGVRIKHNVLASKSAKASIKYYAQTSKQGVLIGNDMKVLPEIARANGLGTIQGLPKPTFEALTIKFGNAVGGKLSFADKISLMYNKKWMNAVVKNKVKVFRYGTSVNGPWLQLELKILAKHKYPYTFL